ncbi:hypothetical protein PSPO_b1072 [Pseudoalteromonas spongiae UST010723-006]|nr:hypothetical protein PSPO_b1072 [Pseudoalteromonas spongiae UST010723-006]
MLRSSEFVAFSSNNCFQGVTSFTLPGIFYRLKSYFTVYHF